MDKEPQDEAEWHAAATTVYDRFFTRRTTAVWGASDLSKSWLTQYGATQLSFGMRRP